MISKGRRVTYLTIVFGVLVLLVAAVAFKGPIVEGWYLWKLESADREKQWAIAAKLARMGSKGAEEWYLKQLESDSVEDRRSAAETLGEMGSLKAVPLIMKRVRIDDDSQVIDPLEGIALKNKAAIVPTLVDALRDKSTTVRVKAAHTLRIVGPEAKPAIPLLIESLNDKVHVMRAYAAHAIGDIGAEASVAIPALEQRLEDERAFVQEAAADALKKIRGE